MKNQINKSKHELNSFHLAIFGLFVLAFSIRIYGANAIGITDSEAEVLLSVTGIKPSAAEPFFYSLIIQMMQFLGFNCTLGIRIINVLMGSLITILPALFYKEIGKKTAIIASLLFAFDPFGIANSIVFSGNSVTILLVGLLVDALIHDREYLIQLVVLLLICNGRGLGYFSIFSLIFLIVLFFVDKDTFYAFLKNIIEKTSTKKNSMITWTSIIFVLFLAIIFKNPFSNIAADISNFILGLSKNYQIGNYPIVYPFAIFSYMPVALVFTLIFLIKKPEAEIKLHRLGSLWLGLVFAVITFYPRHLMIDLIWVSLPLWLITSFLISKYFSVQYHLQKDNWPFLGILLVTEINLGLNMVSLVYRSIWGLDVTNTLLTILLISVFTIVLWLYQAYVSSISKALSALVLITLFMGGLVQLSISARTAASNQKPENEIIWNGYFEGRDIVGKIIENTKTSITGTTGLLNIFIDGKINPSEIWLINKERLFFQKSDISSNNPEVVVSSNQAIAIRDDPYQGQEYISNSYPLWTWDPVRSFISTDFWNWFFFRSNLQYKEYNSIWINKTFVNKQIITGAN